jgi:hypothetical protein
MDEPTLYNHSAFHVSVLPILDREGAHARVVIVKATYDITPGEPQALVSPQPALRLGDVLWGAPEVADIRLPGDFYAAKPGTDFVLCGHAHPPEGQAVAHRDVLIDAAGRSQHLRVHGPREWRRSATGVVPGPSSPLIATPLAWSRAYGGLDLSKPQQPLEEARNPVGQGLCHRPEQLLGQSAPQIEDPQRPISTAGGVQPPAGCAPLGRHFTPRRQWAGTYDETWVQKTYPARPVDFDERHEHFAPAPWVFDEPLVGGEAVRIEGVHPRHVLQFTLPRWRVAIDARIDGQTLEHRPHLDTVLVNSDTLQLELIWRTLFRCPPKMRERFTAVRVQTKSVQAKDHLT